MRCLVALACASGVAACPSAPEVGEFGRFRYVGRVQGQPPLRLLPPVADGSGAIYTLFGDIDLPQVAAFVSPFGGGEVGGCTLTKGDRFGAHGFVGFIRDKQWYWAGDALVELTAIGGCKRVLDRDPGTDADLQFKGVLPWVRDAPSRPSVVVLVRSPADRAPYSAVVDLNAGILSNVRPFEPSNATAVKVIGVGANRETNVGFTLLSYERGGGVVHEARFYDAEGELTATTGIESDPLPEYGVRGYLQISDAGLVVGLLSTGNLVAFDRDRGRIIGVDKNTIEGIGVHRWEGKLYLVGTVNRRAVIAPIDDNGVPGPVDSWEASALADGSLTGPQDILDDRSRPARETTWAEVQSAIGPASFLSAHSPIEHSPGTTLWVVAGPQVDTGGSRITSFAMAPVGISYP